MDCSPPGSSVHGISQARIFEWVAISFSGATSWPRDGWTQVFWISRGILYHLATRKALYNLCFILKSLQWHTSKNMSPLYRWGNWDPEKGFAHVYPVREGEPEAWTQICEHQSLLAFKQRIMGSGQADFCLIDMTEFSKELNALSIKLSLNVMYVKN